MNLLLSLPGWAMVLLAFLPSFIFFTRRIFRKLRRDALRGDVSHDRVTRKGILTLIVSYSLHVVVTWIIGMLLFRWPFPWTYLKARNAAWIDGAFHEDRLVYPELIPSLFITSFFILCTWLLIWVWSWYICDEVWFASPKKSLIFRWTIPKSEW